MPRTPTITRSYEAGGTPGAVPPGFTLNKMTARTAVTTRMTEGNRYVRNVSVSYRLGRSGGDVWAKTGRGKFGVVPTVEVEMVDEIAPMLRSALAASVMMTKYRAVAKEILEQAWKSSIIESFMTGPARWPPLSPHYAAWKRRQRFWTPVVTSSGKKIGSKLSRLGSGVADLVLSGKVRGNVFNKAGDAVGSTGRAANPIYHIDALKQFKTTPYVWLHEWGNPTTHLPQRSFIRNARTQVAPAMAGIVVSEFVIISKTFQGEAVATPDIKRIAQGVETKVEGTLSWGWMARWFSHPYWWVVPPSKALLYFGIASDVRSVLTRGIQLERMVVPFASAWGLGMTGAKMGVPLTKKTARRRFRRGLWRG